MFFQDRKCFELWAGCIRFSLFGYVGHILLYFVQYVEFNLLILSSLR